jgi:hypothetical protein
MVEKLEHKNTIPTSLLSEKQNEKSDDVVKLKKLFGTIL